MRSHIRTAKRAEATLDALEADRAAVPAPPPFAGLNLLEVLPRFGEEFTRPSWVRWRVFLRALFAQPLDVEELAIYGEHTGRTTPPTVPVREAWALVGRRGGKSKVASVLAAFLAGQDYSHVLTPGERGMISVIAADRPQAQIIFSYLKATLQEVPELRALVVKIRKESIELSNHVTIVVHAASYRTTRGYTTLACLADEVAFWRSADDSTNPDKEILAAVRPSMLTVPGALLLCISTVYARKGETFAAFQRYFGQQDAEVLVWKGRTEEMNPEVDRAQIQREREADPVAASAEYDSEFRSDVAAFMGLDAIQACVPPGRRELAPREGVRYLAFTDPSGGSQDAFTLAIAHAEGNRGVLDCVREIRPPFSPDSATAELAEAVKAYGLMRVTGDHYGGLWPAERFAAHGITYEASEQTKSDLYLSLLPLVNAGRCDLLDVPRLVGQLAGLERRTARSGKDSVDHPRGLHDDVANAVAGALVLAAGRPVVALGSVEVDGLSAPSFWATEGGLGDRRWRV